MSHICKAILINLWHYFEYGFYFLILWKDRAFLVLYKVAAFFFVNKVQAILQKLIKHQFFTMDILRNGMYTHHIHTESGAEIW